MKKEHLDDEEKHLDDKEKHLDDEEKHLDSNFKKKCEVYSIFKLYKVFFIFNNNYFISK